MLADSEAEGLWEAEMLLEIELEMLADSEALGLWLAEILADVLAEILAEVLAEIELDVLAEIELEILADIDADILADIDAESLIPETTAANVVMVVWRTADNVWFMATCWNSYSCPSWTPEPKLKANWTSE